MMESWRPTSPGGRWFLPERRAGAWTLEENKLFEQALAGVDWDAPDRWDWVAALLSGRTVADVRSPDVRSHYDDLESDVGFIEAGLVPFPHNGASGGPGSHPAGFPRVQARLRQWLAASAVAALLDLEPRAALRLVAPAPPPPCAVNAPPPPLAVNPPRAVNPPPPTTMRRPASEHRLAATRPASARPPRARRLHRDSVATLSPSIWRNTVAYDP